MYTHTRYYIQQYTPATYRQGWLNTHERTLRESEGFHSTSHHERVGTLVVDRGSNSQVVEDAGLVNVVQGCHVRNHLGVVGVCLTEALQDAHVGRPPVGDSRSDAASNI